VNQISTIMCGKENSRLLPRLPSYAETVQYFLPITPKVLSIATVNGKTGN
jgi:hypothetical protein